MLEYMIKSSKTVKKMDNSKYLLWDLLPMLDLWHKKLKNMVLMTKLSKLIILELLESKIKMEKLSSNTMSKKVIFGECVKLKMHLLKIGSVLLLLELEIPKPLLFSG